MRFFSLSKDNSFQRRKLEFEAERTWRTARYTIRLKEEIFDQTLNSGSRGREGRAPKSGIPSRQETDEGFWKVLSSRMMLASFSWLNGSDKQNLYERQAGKLTFMLERYMITSTKVNARRKCRWEQRKIL